MPRMFTVKVLACVVAWSMTSLGVGQVSLTPASTLPSQTEIDGFKRAIRTLYDLKEKAWAAGDAETIVTKFYSEDAISLGEGDPNTMVGREQFRAAYQTYVKDVPSVRIESVRSYVNGNAGWDWANFYSSPKPGKKSLYPPSPIRILFTWAKENGRWICKGDIFVNGRFPKQLDAAAVK
jgi:uncharacterized protein (TIGR02246 family)